MPPSLNFTFFRFSISLFFFIWWTSFFPQKWIMNQNKHRNSGRKLEISSGEKEKNSSFFSTTNKQTSETNRFWNFFTLNWIKNRTMCACVSFKKWNVFIRKTENFLISFCELFFQCSTFANSVLVLVYPFLFHLSPRRHIYKRLLE